MARTPSAATEDIDMLVNAFTASAMQVLDQRDLPDISPSEITRVLTEVPDILESVLWLVKSGKPVSEWATPCACEADRTS